MFNPNLTESLKEFAGLPPYDVSINRGNGRFFKNLVNKYGQETVEACIKQTIKLNSFAMFACSLQSVITRNNIHIRKD